MTEPTQEQEDQARNFLAPYSFIDGGPHPYWLAKYAAPLQAKIDRLEIGMVELEKVAGRLKAENDELRATHVPKEDAWDAVCNGSRKDKARIAAIAKARESVK